MEPSSIIPPTIYDVINQATGLIIPEIILLATVCLMFLAGPFLVSETGQAPAGLRHRWGILSLLALSCAFVAWSNTSVVEPGAGPFRSDALVWYVRGLSLTAGILLTLLLWDQIDDGKAAEAHACLLAIIAGTNFVTIANDLVTVFLGLELVSIPTYVLLILPRRDWKAREATIKYFLLSIFSSALVLYGLSWVFGIAGTTNLTAIAARAADVQFDVDRGMFRIAMLLVIAGLSFRITAVPFHFYAPDVFQGVTSSSAAMLSFIPKLVGFSALLRLLSVSFGATSLAVWTPSEVVRFILAVLAIATMFVGNLLALRQTNILRLLAYSSIAHAGYMLVGLAVGANLSGTSGIAALLFYVAIYGVMTLGVFALLTAAGSFTSPIKMLSELSGLGRTQPVTALLMAVCVFGLSGLPPTGGFLGKLNLFLAAWSDGSTTSRVLAIVLAVNAVIGASYYLRMIGLMYLEPSSAEQSTGPAMTQPAALVAGMFCAAATLIVFVSPQWLWDAATLLAKS